MFCLFFSLTYIKNSVSNFFLFKIYLFYFWLCWVCIAALWLSLVAASGGYSSLQCAGFSLWWLLLLRSMGSRRAGFSSCGLWVLKRRFSSCGARGLVAPRHVGSSWIRDRTRVPCIGRRILNHCATREVPLISLHKKLCDTKKTLRKAWFIF